MDVQFINKESVNEFVIVINIESNHHKIKLTKKKEDIRNFCLVPRSAQEIMERLGISNQSKNRQKYIGELLAAGVLEMTIPNNPKDKNQRYRKVIRG